MEEFYIPVSAVEASDFAEDGSLINLELQDGTVYQGYSFGAKSKYQRRDRDNGS